MQASCSLCWLCIALIFSVCVIGPGGTHSLDVSGGWRVGEVKGGVLPRHPPEGFQVLAELLQAVSGRNKLLLTPLNQSLLHHLHTDGLQPGNLKEGRYEQH